MFLLKLFGLSRSITHVEHVKAAKKMFSWWPFRFDEQQQDPQHGDDGAQVVHARLTCGIHPKVRLDLIWERMLKEQ